MKRLVEAMVKEWGEQLARGIDRERPQRGASKLRHGKPSPYRDES